jgi:hypothetical protein
MPAGVVAKRPPVSEQERQKRKQIMELVKSELTESGPLIYTMVASAKQTDLPS